MFDEDEVLSAIFRSLVLYRFLFSVFPYTLTICGLGLTPSSVISVEPTPVRGNFDIAHTLSSSIIAYTQYHMPNIKSWVVVRVFEKCRETREGYKGPSG